MKGLFAIPVLVVSLSAAHATGICSVNQVSIAPGGLLVRFAGNSTWNIVTSAGPAKGEPSHYEYKNGALESKGKHVTGVFISFGGAAYFSEGFTESCVLRAVDADDRRKGLLVEQYLHAPQTAPGLKTEFITVVE